MNDKNQEKDRLKPDSPRKEDVNLEDFIGKALEVDPKEVDSKLKKKRSKQDNPSK